MSSPSPPSSERHVRHGSRLGAVGEATAWLLQQPRPAALPSFMPAVQADAVMEIWTGGGADLQALEERCLAGDSATARALAAVHATVVGLGEVVARTPRSSLRDRLVASAAAMDPGARPADAVTVSPVVAVGMRHAVRPGEHAREAALAAVGADVRGGDPALQQVLDRVAALVDFPLLVVSVVTGDETVHRAFRCTIPGVDGPPPVVPRAASFCTHCVADGAPLVISDASSDPFFARHPAVTAFHLIAYFGVPLRLANGAIVGTLCAYDVRPRDIGIEDVAVLEVFSRRVVAHLEGESPSTHGDILDPASSLVGGDVYAAPLFEDLLQIERLRVVAGRAAALVVAGPLDASGLALDVPGLALDAPGLAPDPPGLALDAVAGRLRDGRAAWLLSGQHAERAGALAAAVSRATGCAAGIAGLAPGEDPGSVAGWIERAATP